MSVAAVKMVKSFKMTGDDEYAAQWAKTIIK